MIWHLNVQKKMEEESTDLASNAKSVTKKLNRSMAQHKLKDLVNYESRTLPPLLHLSLRHPTSNMNIVMLNRPCIITLKKKGKKKYQTSRLMPC